MAQEGVTSAGHAVGVATTAAPASRRPSAMKAVPWSVCANATVTGGMPGPASPVVEAPASAGPPGVPSVVSKQSTMVIRVDDLARAGRRDVLRPDHDPKHPARQGRQRVARRLRSTGPARHGLARRTRSSAAADSRPERRPASRSPRRSPEPGGCGCTAYTAVASKVTSAGTGTPSTHPTLPVRLGTAAGKTA